MTSTVTAAAKAKAEVAVVESEPDKQGQHRDAEHCGDEDGADAVGQLLGGRAGDCASCIRRSIWPRTPLLATEVARYSSGPS